MNGGLESLGRVRLQGLALLAVAFLVGALAGVAGDRLVAHRRPPFEHFDRRAGPLRPGGFPPTFERLNLTPDQRARIRGIFEKYRPRTDSVLRESMPRLRALTDSARAEMRAVLTPEQRARMDSMWGAFPGQGGRGLRFRGPEPGGRPPRH